MNAETLNCNNCGAPLSVPAAAKYATCAHCGTQLAIRRTESVACTGYIKAQDFQAAHRRYLCRRANVIRENADAPGQIEPSDPAGGAPS